MKVAAGTIAGLTVGITMMIVGRRYTGALLWWIFTTDLRSAP